MFDSLEYVSLETLNEKTKSSRKTALKYSDSDSLVVHNGMKFCTKDGNNDIYGQSCAQVPLVRKIGLDRATRCSE